jgi:hypothetical protein
MPQDCKVRNAHFVLGILLKGVWSVRPHLTPTFGGGLEICMHAFKSRIYSYLESLSNTNLAARLSFTSRDDIITSGASPAQVSDYVTASLRPHAKRLGDKTNSASFLMCFRGSNTTS